MVYGGETAFSDLLGRDLLLIEGQREQIRVEVDCIGEIGTRLLCDGSVKASLEIFNNGSGRTEIQAPVTTTFLPPDEIVTTRPGIP